MARVGRPWAVVITAAACALVAAGALAVAASLRDRDAAASDATTTTASTPGGGAGVDGCLVQPCQVLATTNVGGTQVELVADNGNMSGRLRIGGAGSSDVVEATITSMGAQLGPESLQCVPGTLAACLLRGESPDGIVGQIVVGRSTKWNELAQSFQSDAGYLALAEVTPDTGAEILVAQHRCDRGAGDDCSRTPVFVRVYNLRSQDLGCTRNYDDLESLPGWPVVAVDRDNLLNPCP
ncbi:hypothetical protein [Actinophytocola oryzae]|uniref:Uncharacterized protein n=1 Tax=Actinophytocola oryzae TaxID=502181 RepID=A0A4R7USF7_9PSEU|nr:hypothetical protein [Actinophytocola oryzae]TDV36874.1 hypothetical protein CLV71_13080 [Actinophytocola oryzae]